MVILWLALVAASAGQVARWEAVEPLPDRPGGYHLPSGDLPVRARCPEAPVREALFPGGVLRGPFSTASPGEAGWWRFPAAPTNARDQRLDPRCTVQVLRTAADAMALAHAERAHGSPEALAATLPLPAADQAWVDAGPGESWRRRWLAARPPGPWPAGLTTLAAAEARHQGGDWWEGSPRFFVDGPARVRVQATRPGDGPLCLRVDEVEHCAAAAVDRLEPGQGWTRARTWRLLVADGPHTLEIPGPARARAVASYPEDELAGPLPHPGPTLVTPVAAGTARSPVPADGREVHLLMARSGDPEELAPDVPRWVERPGEGDRWLSDTGALSLWFPDPPPRRLALGDGAWESRDPAALHRLQWTGSTPAPLPDLEGALVRVEGRSGPWVATAWVLTEGEPVRWEAPADARLWVAVPPGEERQVRAAGYVWTVIGGEPFLQGAQGRAFAAGVPLQVGPGPVEAWADQPAAMRLTAPRPAGLEEAPGAESADSPAPPAAGAPASLDHLLAATRRVAEGDAPAEALVARAAILEGLGATHLAWLDLERARWLDAGPADSSELSRRLTRERARLLAGPDRWVPLGDAWVPAGLDAAAAARGDFLTLARSAPDPRPWWRRAIVGGQVLTGPERVRAYADLVRHTPADQVDHPWLWPLRALSRWERIHQVRGATVTRVARPAPEPDQVEEALFPDPWDPASTVELGPGWEIALPPSQEPARIEARCRPARALPLEGCALEVVDGSGEVVAMASLPPWGLPATLDVPAHAGRLFARIAAEGALAQVRLPVAQTLSPTRRAWSVPRGGAARLQVLGPTVLRVESDAPVVLAVVDPAGARWRREVPRGDTRIPLDGEGLLRVTLGAPEGARLVPSMRVARATSRPVAEDALPPRGALPLLAPPLPVDAAEGRPPARPRLTAVAEARVGTEADDVALTDAWSPGLAAGQALGLEGRGGGPLWWSLSASLEESGAGLHLEERAGGDWRLSARPLHAWLVADVWAVQAVSGPSLSAARARVRLQADRRVERWQGVGRLEVLGHAALAGGATADLPVHLWSTWRSDHPLALRPHLEVRFLRPWTRLVAWGALTSNPVPDTVDQASVGLHADLARPGAWLRLGGQLDRRMRDDLRLRGSWSPVLRARGELWLWPHRDAGVCLFAATWVRPLEPALLLSGGVRLRASRDRALHDLRPSRHPMRHAGAWGQHAAAERLGGER